MKIINENMNIGIVIYQILVGKKIGKLKIVNEENNTNNIISIQTIPPKFWKNWVFNLLAGLFFEY